MSNYVSGGRDFPIVGDNETGNFTIFGQKYFFDWAQSLSYAERHFFVKDEPKDWCLVFRKMQLLWTLICIYAN